MTANCQVPSCPTPGPWTTLLPRLAGFLRPLKTSALSELDDLELVTENPSKHMGAAGWAHHRAC